MAVHTLRIDSNAAWCSVEIRSTGTWARGPGRTLRYQARGHTIQLAELEIDDRRVRLIQHADVRSELTLVIQLATVDDRVSLHCTKSPHGAVRVTSAANSRINNGQEENGNELNFLLFLDTPAASEAGAQPGDPALAGDQAAAR